MAIVGYGPVGKLLALQLGRRGHQVLVVDKEVEPYPLPRAVTHCADVARILQAVGLSPDTIPDVTEPYDDMYVWRNGDGRTLVEVDWSGRGESGWFNTYFFHQPDLEARLDALIAQLPSVRVWRGWEAEQLVQQERHASVSLRSAIDGRRVVVDASWLVGADGANSRVREWLGIDNHDEGYFHDWLVVDVVPAPGARFPDVAYQVCDPRRPASMVPGGPGRRRWEFMCLPGETADDLNSAEAAWALLKPYGLTADNAELERHSTYRFQARWATRWRLGRALLAGDAAHVMPPFAGQGLGAGARDAMNLAWKLDAVLRGVAGDGLLDSYEPERVHHTASFIRFSMGLGQVICVTDADAAAERDARMIAEWDAEHETPPRPPRPGLGAGLHVGAVGGCLARQGRVRVGRRAPERFDDAFGGPGAVIVRASSQLADVPESQREILRQLSTDLVALSGPGAEGISVIDDADRIYHDWLDEIGADAVLVRPDFHVYGAADAAGVADLVTGFVTGLHPGAKGSTGTNRVR